MALTGLGRSPTALGSDRSAGGDRPRRSLGELDSCLVRRACVSLRGTSLIHAAGTVDQSKSGGRPVTTCEKTSAGNACRCPRVVAELTSDGAALGPGWLAGAMVPTTLHASHSFWHGCSTVPRPVWCFSPLFADTRPWLAVSADGVDHAREAVPLRSGQPMRVAPTGHGDDGCGGERRLGPYGAGRKGSG